MRERFFWVDVELEGQLVEGKIGEGGGEQTKTHPSKVITTKTHPSKVITNLYQSFKLVHQTKHLNSIPNFTLLDNFERIDLASSQPVTIHTSMTLMILEMNVNLQSLKRTGW